MCVGNCGKILTFNNSNLIKLNHLMTKPTSSNRIQGRVHDIHHPGQVISVKSMIRIFVYCVKILLLLSCHFISVVVMWLNLYGPVHKISVFMASVSSKGSGESTPICRLTRT